MAKADPRKVADTAAILLLAAKELYERFGDGPEEVRVVLGVLEDCLGYYDNLRKTVTVSAAKYPMPAHHPLVVLLHEWRHWMQERRDPTTFVKELDKSWYERMFEQDAEYWAMENVGKLLGAYNKLFVDVVEEG